MNDQQYMQHCRRQFADFSATLTARTVSLDESDSLRELAVAFSALAHKSTELYQQGPSLVSRLFETYPDFAPTFPRELLWFFGGDCLHFMPDEEIELFQQLDDLRDKAVNDGKILDFQAAHAKLMK